MQGKLTSKDPKTKKINNAKNPQNCNKTMCRGMPIGIQFLTRSLKSTGKHGFQKGTDIVTDIVTLRLNQPRGRFSEIMFIFFSGAPATTQISIYRSCNVQTNVRVMTSSAEISTQIADFLGD